MLTFRNAWQHDLLRTGGQREGVRCSRGHWNDLLQVVACQDVHDVCDIQCPVSRVILYGSMTSIEDIGFMYSCMNLPTYHHGGEKKPSQESTKNPAAKVWENEFLNFMWDICYVVILNLIIYNICSSCELRLLAQNASNKNQYLKKKTSFISSSPFESQERPMEVPTWYPIKVLHLSRRIGDCGIKILKLLAATGVACVRKRHVRP